MLDTATAEASVLALLDDMEARTDSSAKGRRLARQDYARELVRILATLVRTGTVTGNVTTTGSATTQTGPLTAGKIT